MQGLRVELGGVTRFVNENCTPGSGTCLLLKFSKNVSEGQESTVCMSFECKRISITGYLRACSSSDDTFENVMVRLVFEEQQIRVSLIPIQHVQFSCRMPREI